MKSQPTSWGKVANWYNNLLTTDTDSYQAKVIAPNLTRLVAPVPGQTIVDVATGTGFFAKLWAAHGAQVIAADISSELIALAKAETPAEAGIVYHVAPADKMPMIASASVDALTCVLALQNIAELKGATEEMARILKPGGYAYIVMNHPTFRVPQRSSWVFGEEGPLKVQYRRIDGYMSEQQVAIEMNPGSKISNTTLSFHRPLQVYVKAWGKAGLAMVNMEEWISHKKSPVGPRQKAEDQARHEIPLFMVVVLEKIA
jgi:ubiquinone/menaquinone biosynthesis C-methylase UbiE